MSICCPNLSSYSATRNNGVDPPTVHPSYFGDLDSGVIYFETIEGGFTEFYMSYETGGLGPDGEPMNGWVIIGDFTFARPSSGEYLERCSPTPNSGVGYYTLYSLYGGGEIIVTGASSTLCTISTPTPPTNISTTTTVSPSCYPPVPTTPTAPPFTIPTTATTGIIVVASSTISPINPLIDGIYTTPTTTNPPIIPITSSTTIIDEFVVEHVTKCKTDCLYLNF